MWEDYNRRAHEHVQALGDRALEPRYEDLLKDPYPCLKNIARFCELRIQEPELRRQAQCFDPARAFAYRCSPELIGFSQMVQELLQLLGC